MEIGKQGQLIFTLPEDAPALDLLADYASQPPIRRMAQQLCQLILAENPASPLRACGEPDTENTFRRLIAGLPHLSRAYDGLEVRVPCKNLTLFVAAAAFDLSEWRFQNGELHGGVWDALSRTDTELFYEVPHPGDIDEGRRIQNAALQALFYATARAI
jgi:hypothetical protein